MGRDALITSSQRPLCSLLRPARNGGLSFEIGGQPVAGVAGASSPGPILPRPGVGEGFVLNSSRTSSSTSNNNSNSSSSIPPARNGGLPLSFESGGQPFAGVLGASLSRPILPRSRAGELLNSSSSSSNNSISSSSSNSRAGDCQPALGRVDPPPSPAMGTDAQPNPLYSRTSSARPFSPVLTARNGGLPVLFGSGGQPIAGASSPRSLRILPRPPAVRPTLELGRRARGGGSRGGVGGGHELPAGVAGGTGGWNEIAREDDARGEISRSRGPSPAGGGVVSMQLPAKRSRADTTKSRSRMYNDYCSWCNTKQADSRKRTRLCKDIKDCKQVRHEGFQHFRQKSSFHVLRSPGSQEVRLQQVSTITAPTHHVTTLLLFFRFFRISCQ